MPTRVAILGAGPAGLAAAHAAYLAGAWVDIYSHPEKSRLYGCQYLHQELPGIRAEVLQTTVRYQLRGDADTYRQKIYGDFWNGTVSAEDLTGDHEAWDIRAAYDWLWDAYVFGWADKGMNEQRAMFYPTTDLKGITPAVLQHRGIIESHDFTISTIPAPAVCAEPMRHTFSSIQIWAVGDAHDRGQLSPVTAPQDTVLCNGELDGPSWYRVSNVFGMSTVEWPISVTPPIPYKAKVSKPLYTDCDCWPNMFKMGRYGAWKKGELVHDVFNKTAELLK